MADSTKPNWGYSVIAAFVAAAVLTIWKNGGINSHGMGDALMFVGFIVFMLWLLIPRRNKASGGQHADDGFALRFGQFLKRILRPLDRKSVV